MRCLSLSFADLPSQFAWYPSLSFDPPSIYFFVVVYTMHSPKDDYLPPFFLPQLRCHLSLPAGPQSASSCQPPSPLLPPTTPSHLITPHRQILFQCLLGSDCKNKPKMPAFFLVFFPQILWVPPPSNVERSTPTLSLAPLINLWREIV